jgi:aquaporin Z
MRSYLTEFIGTFFLVLTIGLVVLDGTAMAPIAIGSVLMVMVYAGGHISGAHYNPAVTLAVALRGAMEWRDVVPYMASQIVGALAAAGCVVAILGDTFAPAPAAGAGFAGVVLVELLFTFALCLVVLNTATAPETDGNSYFGLAIGFTVTVGAFAGGGISGGAFNPAVGIGPIVMDALVSGGSMAALWLYLIAPFAGGALAAVVYKAQHTPATSASGASAEAVAA